MCGKPLVVSLWLLSAMLAGTGSAAPRQMGAPGHPRAAKTGAASEVYTIPQVLEKRYDLTPRYQLGQTTYYRFVQTIYLVGAAQEVLQRIQTSGNFQRQVVKLREDGAAVERITWRKFANLVGSGRTGPFGEPQTVPASENFSYLFCAEDSYENFHWNYESIPKTMLGDGFMMLSINAHFEFDFLRSRSHGAIHQLHRLGDRVVAPDTDRPFTIHSRAIPQSWTCTKRDLTLTFLGLSEVQRHPCALLEFWTWLDVDAELGSGTNRMQRPGHTQFDGHLLVDLQDGSLWRGDFNEWVTLPTLGPTGKETMKTYVEYRMERISTEEFGPTNP